MYTSLKRKYTVTTNILLRTSLVSGCLSMPNAGVKFSKTLAWHGHLRSTSWTEMLRLKGMQVSREPQEQCYDFLSVTFDQVVLCFSCGLLKSICMFMIQFTNHTRMLIIFCLHDCVFCLSA